jgi:superfamily II RNA helicase
MLPAIYFIFSRRGCDKSVDEVSHLSLVTDQEAQELKFRIDTFLAHNPDAGRAGQVGPLYRGIAAHHAGILPLWKGLVEELFQAGLIKVVFATETLAAGINMPARTTVIASLSKRTDMGHRLLTSSEFLQMAGRAGRRGMDEQGHVVTVESPFEGSREAVHLATSGADPLVSQFTPGYGMVLNLLQTHTIDEAKDLIERSFGQYLATLHLVPQQQEIDRLEAAIAHQQAQLAAFDEGYWPNTPSSKSASRRSADCSRSFSSRRLRCWPTTWPKWCPLRSPVPCSPSRASIFPWVSRCPPFWSPRCRGRGSFPTWCA